ncbi:hypothetical protein HNY73_006236 [Argiope bruennichi]|uniref:Uncharacterized protein n=1 Tax=Argiope bruennichi TaxID=94029 RepID=A0A8T0FRL8_ARGBR|nr:hypothetical protein HNY73_006236 [Argiope bruennichi]
MDPMDYSFITVFERQFKTIRKSIDHLKKVHDRLLVKTEMLQWMPNVIFPETMDEQLQLTYTDAVHMMIVHGRQQIKALALHFEFNKQFFGAPIYANRIWETIHDFENTAACLYNIAAHFQMLNYGKIQYLTYGQWAY